MKISPRFWMVTAALVLLTGMGVHFQLESTRPDSGDPASSGQAEGLAAEALPDPDRTPFPDRHRRLHNRGPRPVSRADQILAAWGQGDGSIPRLAREQIDPWLERNGRSAESLLAAFQACNDPALLREALEKFGTDPTVLSQVVLGNPLGLDPEALKDLTDKLYQADPNHALLRLLGAKESLAEGNLEAALQHLQVADSHWAPDMLRKMQNLEELHRAAGWSELEAKLLAQQAVGDPRAELIESIAQPLADRMRQAREDGDGELAEQLAKAGVGWIRNLTRVLGPDGETLEGAVTLRRAQNAIISEMDPGVVYKFMDGQVVRVQQSVQGRLQTVLTLAENESRWLSGLSKAEALQVLEQMKMRGEVAVLSELLARFETPTP